MKVKTNSTHKTFQSIINNLGKGYLTFLAFWIVACLLFSKPIDGLFLSIGSKLFDHPSSGSYDVAVLLLILLYFLTRSYLGRLFPNFDRKPIVVQILIPVAIWFLFKRFFDPSDEMELVTSKWLPAFKLGGLAIYLLLVAEVFYLSLWRNKIETDWKLKEVKLDKQRKDKSKESSFIPDVAFNPIGNNDEDLLGFRPYAQRIAEEAMKVVSDESVVFGINGKWGEGKTSMINLVKDELRAKNFTVVDFTPWKTSSGKEAMQLFFEVLSEAMDGQGGVNNWEIKRRLNHYAQSLLELDQSGIGKAIWKLFHSNVSVEKQKEELQKCLKYLEKNIIVVVDDLDRLAKTEIADILKLMRDAANFPNLVFIAAYDRYYLNKAVKEEINKHEANTYLDKIVLWEFSDFKPTQRIYLRLFHKYFESKFSEYKSELSKLFEDDGRERITDGKKPIAQPSLFYEIIERKFDDLRKIKRFYNFFIFNFEVVKEKVDFIDFFYLTMLKFLSADCFKEFKEAYLRINHRIDYSTEIEHRTEHYFKEFLKIDFDADLKSFISLLTQENAANRSPKRFTLYQNWVIYFHLGNYNQITISDLSILLSSDSINDYKQTLSKESNLINQFTNIELIAAHRDKDLCLRAQKLIWLVTTKNEPDLFRKIFIELHLDFQEKEIFNSEKLDGLRSQLSQFVSEEQLTEKLQPLWNLTIYEYRKDTSFFDIQKVFEFSKENFINHVKQQETFDLKTINWYYSCCHKIVYNHPEINISEIKAVMKRKAYKLRDSFIPFFIAVKGDSNEKSNDKRFIFTDFLIELFDSNEEIVSFLNPENYTSNKKSTEILLKYAIINKDSLASSRFNLEKNELKYFRNALPLEKLQQLYN